MKLKIKEGSENYAARVVVIDNLHPIEGADRIKRTVVTGNNVIVPRTTEIGSEMIYFVSGTRLNEEYCTENNLLDKTGFNKDPEARGYISYKRRTVKAVKLKGVVSDGMLMPLESLSVIGIDLTSISVGDVFTDVGDIDLCEKYIPPVKVQSQGSGKDKQAKNKVEQVLVDNQFRFHYNTPHFANHLPDFKAEDLITITRKRHGSSLILSNVLVKKKLSFIEKILLKLGVNIPEEEYGFIWSSGKPKSKKPKGVSSGTNNWETPNQSFYSKDIWLRAYQELHETVEKGITLYGEITGEGIQGEAYTYGKEYAIHIYRITQTNVDGVVYEFGWNEVKAYCEKYGIKHVEEYYTGRADMVTVKLLTQSFSQGIFDHRTFLKELQETYLDKSLPDCKVDEGICIRDSSNQVFKLKSPNFILQESRGREAGEVDKEEIT